MDEQRANQRLLMAAFNAFDKVGRELNIDAAELAERIDLTLVLRTLAVSASTLTDIATALDPADFPETIRILRDIRIALQPVQQAAGRD